MIFDIEREPPFKDNRENAGNFHNKSIISSSENEKERGGTGHFRISGTPWVSIIKPNDTVLVQCHAAQSDNYNYCKYCKEKGKVIRFQLFEAFRIVNIQSMFDWKKITLRKRWIAFDEDTWNLHRHNDKTEEVAA